MVPAPDFSAFGFSEHGPWVVDEDALQWRRGLHHLRAGARESVPRLLHPGRIPPLWRLVAVCARVGAALGVWYATERRQEQVARRRALSKRLRVAFARLGPTYIKMGQIISSGEGLFPEELVGEFKLLRDRVPPESFEHVRRVVESDLGCKLEDVFAHFEREPIAAASIAQVHAAQLRTGEEVVVKVQRPRVHDLVHDDIRAMAWLAPKLVGRIPIAALANPPALVELFAETIVEELDFRLEAENMLDIARVLAQTDQRAVIVPRPHPTLVTRRVLVMERLDGFAWDDAAGMQRAGVDTEAVLHAGLVSFMEGAMLFGVFHGDLHGGNLLVLEDGTTALLDFGITGRMDPRKRLAFLFLLVGTTTGDSRGQLRALRDLGAFPDDTNLDRLYTDLGLDRQFVDPTTLSADELLHELQELTKNLLAHGARVPKELMLLVKNLLFLDGSIATLAPDLDILGELEAVHTEIAVRHGERLAAEMGIDLSEATWDPDAVRVAMMIDPSIERLTYRDVQQRRETIRRNLEAKRPELRPGVRRKRADGSTVWMPELPQMQALSERLDAIVAGHAITRYVPLGFHGLKTAVPAPEAVLGVPVAVVGRRAKYLAFELADGRRLLIHLSQAGRLDVETPPKATKPRGSVVRLTWGDIDTALLLREHGTERKAGWWVLAARDQGPLAKLGPEPDSAAFAEFVRTAKDNRRLHTMLRDQATVAGIGRGYADDLLHRAHLSPYATLSSLDAAGRERLLGAIAAVLADGLDRERRRTGGLSENKLGEHFTVHGKAGVPCPECGTDLARISYESHEVVYCPQCQTGGKVLADRRTSKFLK